MDIQGSLFGDEVHEYFVLISPDEGICKTIEAWKQEIKRYITLDPVNLRNKAHLSLVKFRRDYDSDDQVLEGVKKALQSFRSFRMVLNDWMVFKHGGDKSSLVLKLKDPDPPKLMSRLLRKQFRLPPKQMVPHVSIVRSIATQECDKIFPLRQELFIHQEFWCDRVTILKKKISSDSAYTNIGEVILK